MTVTVPGNLLLLGEYAVLEEGGLGLTLALDRRLCIRVEPAPRLEVLGSWGLETVRWSDGEPQSSPLFGQIIQACRRLLGELREVEEPGKGPRSKVPELQRSGRPVTGRIHIDSSRFFLSPERKSGFGSSAAVTVGLAWTILLLGGLDPDTTRRVVPELALRSHRALQGGGSGYDVFTSTYGGMGLFTGGERPSWRARAIGWLPPLYLLRGPRSVSTARAVESYREWRERKPAEARRFLERSNAAVRDFLQARSWREAEPAFRRSREEGLWLGEQIGVAAHLELPEALAGARCKALGAGDELGVVVLPAEEGVADSLVGLEPLVPAREGVLWEA